MSDDKHVIELLPAYALGSLDEDELLVVSTHLGTCERCREELISYELVGDQLMLAVPEYVPPRNLIDSILSKVMQKNDREEPGRGVSKWLRSMKPAWNFIGVGLILALGITSLTLWQEVNQLQSSTSEMGQQEVFLQSSGVNLEDAKGVLLISKNDLKATLIVEGLPVLKEGYQYQLWLIKDGLRDSGGVFSVSQGGYGFLTISSADEFSSYHVFGITVEPAGGSSAPTGEKVLGSDL